MNAVPPAIQNLARQLIDFETVRGKPAAPAGAAMSVCGKLRGKLSKFTGVAGFSSLLARAVALAKADVPLLNAVLVKADGSLEGFDEVERDPDPAAAENAGFVLVTRLLGLLVTFIGETLTLRLVRDIWPNASLMDKTTNENDGGRS